MGHPWLRRIALHGKATPIDEYGRNEDHQGRGKLTGTERIRSFVEHRATQRWITTLIVLNAVVLALETSPAAMAAAGSFLKLADRVILAIFVVEILLKVVGQRRDFVRDAWNHFDTIVVAIALIPATEFLSVMRALRILRVFRLISAVPSMRRVVGALLHAVPGMGSVVMLLAVIYFVFSVMATNLFAERFPDWFGNIGSSAYTLFQIMTLESWSMGIVRPVMEVFPHAWLFFVPFILITSFAVLNLFIGIIVDAMQTHGHGESITATSKASATSDPEPTLADLQAEIRAMRAELTELKRN